MQPTTPLAGEKITTTGSCDRSGATATIHAEVEGSEVAPYVSVSLIRWPVPLRL